MKRLGPSLRLALAALAGLLVVASGAWGALALWFQPPWGRRWRGMICAMWIALVLALLAWAITWRSAWPLLGYAFATGGLLVWWQTIKPSHQRDWADDVSQLLRGRVTGESVTLEHVRNFRWRRETDYDMRWETRAYDLRQLSSAEVIQSFWSSRAIAHAMISFGFDNGEHVAFSVEIRRKRGEAFSSIGGFFKQFEMILMAADEADIVRVRTNVRGEDDYLYPLSISVDTMRSLFLAYVEAANQLADTPRFYNTVSSNCTTLVYRMGKRLDPGLPLDIRLLLTGYLAGYLYDAGALDHRLSLSEWTQRGHITERARMAGPEEDFSAAIRRVAGRD